VGTWDLGLSMRIGARFAAGAVVRDLTTPRVAGANVQRRWEAELVSRPLATDRLELGLGGRIGEDRADVDAWGRVALRIGRGFYLRAGAESRLLHAIDTTPSGDVVDSDERELRLTAGIEISLGGLGVASYGIGKIESDRDRRFVGGTIVARLSEEELPSLLPAPRRIERLELSGGMSARSHTALIAGLQRIERDGDVAAVLVKLDGLSVGWASAEDIRNQLLAIRKAGKKVLVYMIEASGKDYYIATAADRIWVDPAGGVRLAGMAGTQLHFRDLFDQIGVNPQFEKIEEYKSAPESFTRTEPSEPALRMRNELYDDLYATIVDDIASGRHKSADEIRALIDGGPYTAGQLAALPALVDGVVAPDDLGKAVREALGARAAPFLPRPNRRATRWDHPAMAVIYIEGDIVTGRSQTIPLLGRRLAGADTIVAAIAAARADAGIDAIVLRIDSPGGHALASEVIAREVFKTRGVKPIICSLGDLAASGGYFVAAGCDRIFAEPTTITGSIGIFVGKVDLSALLSRLGVSWTTFKRGAAADRESYFRPYSEDEKQRVKEQIRYYYDRFVEYVGKGRGMTAQEVDDVGRGRVWTGRQASGLKLVDELGGIGDAIAYAKDKAGIDKDTPTRVVQLPEAEASLLGKLLGVGLSEHDDASLALAPGIRDLARALPGSLWVDPGQPQALLPFAVVWE
jgi:protease-4